jgi:hypothetical protein
MGKTQSKRSVDITTEVGKDGVATEEGTGKMGKIEDVDQLKPQLNGDTNHKDTEDKDIKVVKDDVENEKDNVTEKEATPVVENGAGGDAEAPKIEEKSDDVNTAEIVVENGTPATETEEANATATTLDESKVSEATEATAIESGDGAAPADSNKKPKKEKTKKRWSFRSFSFSKKDKQKPEKKKNADDAAANETAAAVTNGDCEKVVEEPAEEAAVVAEKSSEAVPADAAATANGESVKAENGESRNETSSAPSAASNDKTSAPVAVEPKPTDDIKQVVEQTIEEAVKSVDEKINLVSKPEVNDVTELNENAPQLEKNDQSNELSNVEPISNITDNSAGLGDNSTNNNSPPPPLPENPPPSQVSVFAETAMTVDDTLLPAPAHPQPCPIISTTVQSDLISIGNTKLELINAAECVVDEVLADAKNDVEEKVAIAQAEADAGTVTESANVEIVPDENEKINDAVVAKSEEVVAVAAAAANSDIVPESSVNEITQEDVPIASIEETLIPAKELNDELEEPIKDDISNDISSPLQQNSLESLPSPQSLSSETEQHTESEPTPIVDDSVLPPPPIDEIVNDIPADNSVAIDASVTVIDDVAVVEIKPNELPSVETNAVEESLPQNDSVPQSETVNAEDSRVEPIVTVADVKTNGQHGEAIPSADEEKPTTNGGCKENGTTFKSEKENGVNKENAAETSATESVNGDAAHKKIDEIVPLSDKLEKVAAIQPTTEVIAAE